MKLFTSQFLTCFWHISMYIFLTYFHAKSCRQVPAASSTIRTTFLLPVFEWWREWKLFTGAIAFTSMRVFSRKKCYRWYTKYDAGATYPLQVRLEHYLFLLVVLLSCVIHSPFISCSTRYHTNWVCYCGKCIDTSEVCMRQWMHSETQAYMTVP